MSLFPIYDEMTKITNNEEMNEKHCAKITMLSKDHIEIIYLLILHYWLMTNKGKAKSLKKEYPYYSKTMTKGGKGLTFKLKQIPPKLQTILVNYLNYISEDK